MVKVVNNKIKNILQKLIDNGYEAYVVGGFVRDYILGIETYDVDISTSAEPKDVKQIFELSSPSDDKYGSVSFKDKLYNYDITTFRKELNYENRRPTDFIFVDTISEDIKRRDFTINALYMDINGRIYDEFNSMEDLNNRTIRVIGNIQEKMIEDPLRILRAVRFAAVNDFVLEKNLELFIKQNKQLIQTLSYNRKKQELDLMFKSSNCLKGIKLLKDLNLCDVLELTIDKEVANCLDSIGIWAQIEYSKEYPFSNSEKELIESIQKIINYGIIDNVVLYEYGLYASVIAGEIIGLNRSYISEIYKDLPIYSQKDIQINGDDIQKILDIEPSARIKDIIHDLELNILNNIIKNTPKDLQDYIIKNWR